MAAGGERKIESNQFAIDVSCFNVLRGTSNLVRRFLPASVFIYIIYLSIESLYIYDIYIIFASVSGLL